MFIFKYDYGFDTLQVNARLKSDDNYLKKVTLITMKVAYFMILMAMHF